MRPLAVFVIVSSLLLAGCGRSTNDKFGQELYEISCARCHGDRGQGGLVGPAIGTSGSRAALEFEDSQIFGAIEVGPGSMPGNPFLTEAQITSLVDYLRALQRGE